MKTSMLTKMMQFMLLIGCLATVTHAKQILEISAQTKEFLQIDAKAEQQEDPLPEVEAEIPDELPDELPDGGGQMPMTQHTVEWKAKSELPPALQYTFAGTWIFMLCSMPFIIPLIDSKPVTKTQITVGALMLITLLGGFYLFTNIILFQSGHFKTIRPLTVVECIYFMSQVITTVGYGDVTPAKIRGQVFVGLYVIGALFIIAMVMSDLTDHMVQLARDYKKRIAKERAQKAREDVESGRMVRTGSLKEMVGVPKPSLQPLLTAFAVFVIIDICWIAFFALNPKEGKTIFQALYMSVITLSSVGFGYFTPVTEPGMVFAAFFMLFGCAALVNVITSFTELMVKLNEWERCNEDRTAESMASLKSLTGGSDTVTEAQFMEFTLLQLQCVSEEQLQEIREVYKSLKPSQGVVRRQSVDESLVGTS